MELFHRFVIAFYLLAIYRRDPAAALARPDWRAYLRLLKEGTDHKQVTLFAWLEQCFPAGSVAVLAKLEDIKKLALVEYVEIIAQRQSDDVVKDLALWVAFRISVQQINNGDEAGLLVTLNYYAKFAGHTRLNQMFIDLLGLYVADEQRKNFSFLPGGRAMGC